MTISADTPDKKTYPGDGSTTTFDVVLAIQSADQLKATVVNDTTGAETSLTLNAVSNGFTVTTDLSQLTLTESVAIGSSLVLEFDIPLSQDLDLQTNRAFPPESVEEVLDKLVLLAKQTDEKTNRSIKLAITDDADSFDATLPPTAGNGSKLIGLNSDLTGLQYVTVADGSVVTSNYESETFDGTGAKTEFTLSFTPAIQTAVLVWVGGVRQLPGTDYTISGTTLTFTSAPASGTDNIEVLNLAGSTAANVPANDSVSTAKIQDNAVTLDKIKHGTQGDVFYYGASGAPSRLSAGTDGQVLTSKGASADPVWETPSAGFNSGDITGQTSETLAATDKIVFADTSDSDNLKRNTIQGILDLTAIKSTDITGQTDTAIASGDSIVYSDVSDSGNLKKDTVQGILDLVSVSTTYGAVGTYAQVTTVSNTPGTSSPGDTIAGSQLRAAHVFADVTGGSGTADVRSSGSGLSGTWRIMGAPFNNNESLDVSVLAVRIS